MILLVVVIVVSGNWQNMHRMVVRHVVSILFTERFLSYKDEKVLQ